MKTEFVKQNVGLDISKDDFKACYSGMSSDMEIVKLSSKTFDNTPKGFASFLEWVLQTNGKDVQQLPGFTMEATGVYYENLAYFLVENGYTVHVVLPNHAKKYGLSLGVRSKTDRIDAKTLSEMGLERKLHHWKPFNTGFLKLKQLTRERETVICERTRVNNQLHAYEHRAKSNESTIKRTKEMIDFLNEHVTEIETDIKMLVKSDKALLKRIAYVLSIPGVGFITAVTIIAETDGFASITSIKQLSAFAGLDVKIAQSGKWNGKSKISKQGNSHIRKSLHFPALCKIKHHDKTKQYYERLVEKKGIKMVAAVAVQRKTLGLIYTLWKKEVMFSDKL
jgi:transposase